MQPVQGGFAVSKRSHPPVIVTKRPDGWAPKTPGTERVPKVYPTQRQAEARGRDILENRGGGELITKGLDGKIRSKDTIGRTDPNPPRDREH
jgi:hypothetical protein